MGREYPNASEASHRGVYLNHDELGWLPLAVGRSSILHVALLVGDFGLGGAIDSLVGPEFTPRKRRVLGGPANP
jgi:hypothetical protein